MSVFGFSTEPSKGGDFTPIVKYDSRSGRIFRVDRVDVGNGNFESHPIDITQTFRAVADLENVEVGWIDFAAGSAPDFKLVPMGQKLPDRPSNKHKNGIRFMIKLDKTSGGDKQIREIAGTAKSMLSGVEALYLQYQAEKAKYPGKLPAIVLEKTTPIKTGSGEKTSTNYHPTFKIIGWVERGDLKPQPKANGGGQSLQGSFDTVAAPATGAQRAAPPRDTVDASDFG